VEIRGAKSLDGLCRGLLLVGWGGRGGSGWRLGRRYFTGRREKGGRGKRETREREQSERGPQTGAYVYLSTGVLYWGTNPR